MVAACLEYVVESHDVALDVGVGVGDAVAHTGLGCQVDYDVKRLLVEGVVYQALVCDAAFDEGETVCCHGLQLTEPHFLQPDVVVVVHVVDANDGNRGLGFQQFQNKVGTDEPGSTGHHDIAV